MSKDKQWDLSAIGWEGTLTGCQAEKIQDTTKETIKNLLQWNRKKKERVRYKSKKTLCWLKDKTSYLV